jgi:hypothetical protein
MLQVMERNEFLVLLFIGWAMRSVPILARRTTQLCALRKAGETGCMTLKEW